MASSLPSTSGHTKPAGNRRKNHHAPSVAPAEFSNVKVSRQDLGTFQDGVFQMPETSSSSTAASAPRRKNNKPMNKSAPSTTASSTSTSSSATSSIASASIIQKPARANSGKRLSFAPEDALVQIHHFSATPNTSTSSSHAEDSASSYAAVVASNKAAAPHHHPAAPAAPTTHWAGGAYANSPAPTDLPMPVFAPKAAASHQNGSGSSSTTLPSSAFAAQASLDLRRLLNIPAPASA